ncbi:MAG: hypothetical protein VCD00_17545 [Candidatus Hydrogenedentota bacterium]
MDAHEVAERIAGLEFLSGLDDDTRSQITNVYLDISDVIAYEDGEAIINGGYLAFDTGIILLDGNVTLEFEDQDSVEISAPVLLGEMAQFKSADVRSATVRAKGKAVGAQFYWNDLYRGARETMSSAALDAFQQAIQMQAWERFQYKEILTIPLISSLDEDVRVKVCGPLSVLSESVQLKEIETLFNQGSLCQSTGYILVEGKLKLIRSDGQEFNLSAPNILGIFPNKTDKGTEWTATAMANGAASLLKFSWGPYSDQLSNNLSAKEHQEYIASLKGNGSKHFWH